MLCCSLMSCRRRRRASAAAARRKTASTGIARMLSSNKRVKSNPPRQVGPAQGPNESSGQDGGWDIGSAMDSHSDSGQGRRRSCRQSAGCYDARDVRCPNHQFVGAGAAYMCAPARLGFPSGTRLTVHRSPCCQSAAKLFVPRQARINCRCGSVSAGREWPEISRNAPTLGGKVIGRSPARPGCTVLAPPLKFLRPRWLC